MGICCRPGFGCRRQVVKRTPTRKPVPTSCRVKRTHGQRGWTQVSSESPRLPGYGSFLDHRVTRDLVRAEADGCVAPISSHILAPSVYAADGGAASTTTIDLSKTYLAWAQVNMALNGFSTDTHRFIHADVLRWYEDEARKGPAYDLIVLDPPTFSNSKRAEGTFDVQRDHMPLIQDALRLLNPGGVYGFHERTPV